MGESGATQRITGSTFVRAASRLAAEANWSRVGAMVRGPVLTLATALVFDQLARHNYPIAHPFPFLLFTVVYATYSGGSKPGLLSAVIALAYAVGYLREPGSIVRYTPTNAYSLLGVGVAVLLTVVLVARLQGAARRARDIQLSREEAERVDRRLAFFAAANATLASSLDYHAACEISPGSSCPLWPTGVPSTWPPSRAPCSSSRRRTATPAATSW